MIRQLKIFAFMDLTWDKVKAKKLWEARLEEVKRRGNCKGWGGVGDLFGKQTQQEMELYIEEMIKANT